MFVWVVTYTMAFGEDTEVVGVFDSEEKAKEVAERVGAVYGEAYYERYEMNHSGGY